MSGTLNEFIEFSDFIIQPSSAHHSTWLNLAASSGAMVELYVRYAHICA